MEKKNQSTKIFVVFFCQTDDEDDDGQLKSAEPGTETETPLDSKPSDVTENNNDEPIPEIKSDENLNNGSPAEGADPQRDNNEADDSKELADGEIADLSGDESKPVDAPETIDLGMISMFYRNLIQHFHIFQKYSLN